MDNNESSSSGNSINNSIPPSSTTSLNQESTVTERSFLNRNFKKIVLPVVIVTLLMIVGIIVAYSIGNKQFINQQSKAGQKPEVASPVTNTQSPREGNMIGRYNFNTFLRSNCDSGDEIALEMLPFRISDEVKNKYNIENKVDCVFAISNPEERLGGFISMQTPQQESYNKNSSIIIGTSESNNSGFEENSFETINKIMPTLSVDETSVLVEIMSPGPYGISSEGLWVRVQGYKQAGDYLIISREFQIIEVEGELLDMIIRYKDSESKIEGFPDYTVNQKSEEFKKEFIDTFIRNYPDIDEVYKKLIDEAVKDVSSISLTNS